MIINRIIKVNMYNIYSMSNNSINFIVVWCNGSTKDFGSFSTGSSPVTTTTRICICLYYSTSRSY